MRQNGSIHKLLSSYKNLPNIYISSLTAHVKKLLDMSNVDS
jgi:hypothetical protein